MILEHLIGSAFRSMMTCNEFRGIILLHIHPRFLIWAPESKGSTWKDTISQKCQNCSFAQPIPGAILVSASMHHLKKHDMTFSASNLSSLFLYVSTCLHIYNFSIYTFPVFQLVQESCQQLPTTNINIINRRQTSSSIIIHHPSSIIIIIQHHPTSSSSSSSSSSSNININQSFPVSSWLRSHLWCRLPKSFQSATTDGPLRWFTDDGARGQRPAPKCLSGGLWVVPWYHTQWGGKKALFPGGGGGGLLLLNFHDEFWKVMYLWYLISFRYFLLACVLGA